MLDGILQPMLAVDGARGIALRNRRAEELLRAGTWIRESSQRLHACGPENDALLCHALDELRHGSRRHWAIRFQQGEQHMNIRLRRLGCVGDRELASLTFFEPDAAEMGVEALAATFGLTPAETRVALHIAQGLAPKEVAEICGVSPCTVRSQVRTLFEKTGAHRQAELVRLVLLASMF